MSQKEIIERLEGAIQVAQAEGYDPARLQKALAPVNAWLHEQTQPPCTCGQWQGTPDNGFWYCQRHGVGAGSLSTSGAGAHWSLPPATLTADSHSTSGFDLDAFQYFSVGG